MRRWYPSATGSEIGFQLDTTVDKGTRTIGFKLTNSSGGQMFRYGATTLQTNTWYYVTGVYDATTQTLNVYLNGQLDNGVLVGTVTQFPAEFDGQRDHWPSSASARVRYLPAASTTCGSPITR